MKRRIKFKVPPRVVKGRRTPEMSTRRAVKDDDDLKGDFVEDMDLDEGFDMSNVDGAMGKRRPTNALPSEDWLADPDGKWIDEENSRPTTRNATR